MHFLTEIYNNLFSNYWQDYISDLYSTKRRLYTYKCKLPIATLININLNDRIVIDDKAYIMATLPSNVEHEVPTIGFISHFDTSHDFSGANVKPQVISNYDGGDIVLNADKVRFTGQKMQDKVYRHYTGYPGGQKTYTAQELMARKPNDIVERAVKGMLPKNTLGRQMLTKLKVYKGSEHPHAAQCPQELKI